MSTVLAPLSLPRGLETPSARSQALFLQYVKAAEYFFDFFIATLKKRKVKQRTLRYMLCALHGKNCLTTEGTEAPE